MASHDQSFRAGEAKGRTEEKTNQMMGNIRDKAGAAKDKTCETAQAVKEKAKGATEEAKDKTYEKSEVTKDKSRETAPSARERTEAGKEQTAGFIGKTGEQMKNMAQGAADAVKHTFGMTNADEEGHDPNYRSTRGNY